MRRIRSACFVVPAAWLVALPASAVDGTFAAQGPGPTYYQQATEQQALTSSVATADGAASGGLPTSLHVVEAGGGVVYRSLGDGAWQVDIEMARRPHERVDAVYDLVLALPLPVGATTDQWRIQPRLGSSARSKPVVYGGETVVLKRNVPLETAWLPVLAGAAGGLPDLSRAGYAWTLWDTIVRYDARAGDTLQAYGTFRYAADPGVAAPDPASPENAIYVITWIPTLDDVPPFAIRLDVIENEQE